MTNRQKRELQRNFFRKAGPNVEIFRRMFDLIPNTKFFIIDDSTGLQTTDRAQVQNQSAASQSPRERRSDASSA